MYGFRLMVEGKYACFTRPEFKAERVSYAVPTPGALEGLLKSIYWKPAIRYVIDQIVVFHPIRFQTVRCNEVKEKVSWAAMEQKRKGNMADPCIYTQKVRTQRSSMVLKDVRYGIAFHFALTGIRSEQEVEGASKHYAILKRRLEKGQYFRTPCLGCTAFPVDRFYFVDQFPMEEIDEEIIAMDRLDLGWMSEHVVFRDKGIPLNGDWINPRFSDLARYHILSSIFVHGVIEVQSTGGKRHDHTGSLCVL